MIKYNRKKENTMFRFMKKKLEIGRLKKMNWTEISSTDTAVRQIQISNKAIHFGAHHNNPCHTYLCLSRECILISMNLMLEKKYCRDGAHNSLDFAFISRPHQSMVDLESVISNMQCIANNNGFWFERASVFPKNANSYFILFSTENERRSLFETIWAFNFILFSGCFVPHCWLFCFLCIFFMLFACPLFVCF